MASAPEKMHSGVGEGLGKGWSSCCVKTDKIIRTPLLEGHGVQPQLTSKGGKEKKEKVHQYSTTAHQILPIGVIEDI